MTRQGFVRNLSRFFSRPVLIALLLFFLVGFSPMAKAEVELSIFTGVALTQDNDLQLRQSGGTDLTFTTFPLKGAIFRPRPITVCARFGFLLRIRIWVSGRNFFI